jgi:hypothetical protein
VVLDPPAQKVNVRRMMIYSIFPIVSIYAGWRFQKFWILYGITFLAGFLVGSLVQFIGIPYVFVYVVSFVVNGILSLYIVRYFTNRYNAKLDGSL